MVPTTVCGLGPRSRAPRRRKNGARDIAHGDAGEGDVFNDGAVDGFKREALAAFEDAVGDGDVLEAAVGVLGAELDAARADAALWASAICFQVPSRTRAELVVAGDVAVGDGEVFGRARVARAQRSSWGRCRRPRGS